MASEKFIVISNFLRKKSVEIKIRYDKINLEKKEGDLNFWI